MFRPSEDSHISLPPDSPPRLMVVIDTEEEFDWRKPFSSDETGVTAMRCQHRAQTILDRFGLVPTYVIDYPVASQPDGYEPLKEFHSDGRCLIGAHLHPWVSPPVEEDVNPVNSYPGNLPAALEKEKLNRLAEAIGDAFGARPTIYKAGRYGTGPNTPQILSETGFEIDVSVYAETDLRPKYGPDFRYCRAEPYWFGPDQSLLEIPVTVGIIGGLSGIGRDLYPLITKPLGMKAHLPGIMARTGLLNRIPLTPEGVEIDEAKKLTRVLFGRGYRLFTVCYHSPSLEIGHTPYVKSQGDLDQFLNWLTAYFEFFFGELKGVATTPISVLEEARSLRVAA